MTEKLYYLDSFISSFDARVLSCERSGSGYEIVLDKTAFFPEGGGQSADTGFIGGSEIFDVQQRGAEIIHFARSPLEPGQSLPCRLDFEPRLRRMQNHSGEHMVSGLAHSLYGAENVGFHMGVGSMTIDFDKELSWEQLERVETLANEAIRSALPIVCRFPDAEELKTLRYRSKLELTEDVRIVEIGDIDRCACCAPHLKNTAQVGSIKLLDLMRHRGGVRLTLVCGMDALDTYRSYQSSLTAASRLLSAKRAELPAAVERLLCEQQQNKERICTLSLELARLRAGSVAPSPGNLWVFDDVLDEVALRELVNMLAEKCGGLAAGFSGNDEKGYRYTIISRHLDLRALSKAINAAIGGRGGGRRELIQGQCSHSAGQISAFLSNPDCLDNLLHAD